VQDRYEGSIGLGNSKRQCPLGCKSYTKLLQYVMGRLTEEAPSYNSYLGSSTLPHREQPTISELK
jgi:hypothetical protein